MLALTYTGCSCGGRSLPWYEDASADLDGAIDGPVDAGDGGPGLEPCPVRACDVDDDRDGQSAWPCGGDCDDQDPLVFDGAEDPVGDGVDTSCDQVDGHDQDHDGHLAEQSGGDDCDDLDATVFPGSNDNQGWVSELVPLVGWRKIGIALDRGGAPYLALSGLGLVPDCDLTLGQEGGQSSLAHRRSGAWSTEHLDSWCGVVGELQGPAAVVAGANDFVHVVTAEENLVHFGGRPGSLAEDARIGVGTSTPSVALDRCGRLHAAFGPLHAALADGEWWLDPSRVSEGAGWASLAIDDRDVIHLAYVIHGPSRGPEGLRTSVGYVTIVDGVWSEEQRIPGTEGVASVTLALDPVGAPVVAAHGDGKVIVASWEADRWVVELVDPEGRDDPPAPSLAIGADGTRHVVYSARGLRYATNPGGEWVLRTLASDSYDPSAVLDPAGGLHVAYFGELGDQRVGAMYATYREGLDAIDQNCDGVDGVDADGDGHASVETGGDDADDMDPAVR